MRNPATGSRSGRTAMGVAAIIVVATTALTSPASADSKNTRIVLTQSAPTIVHEEGQDAESARGDVTFYEADLTRAGKAFGTMSGTIETHDIVVDGAPRETRLRTLVFELPKGQLVAKGASTYQTGPDFVPLDIGKPVVIAIIGGTGAYMGATGELRTTRNANGTYRQVITLVRN